MPALVDYHFYHIIWHYIQRFKAIAIFARSCPEDLERTISHVTVLCLDKHLESFGKVFDYVMSSASYVGLPMRACQAQPQEARRLALRDALEAAEKPPNFKGWLFPGAIKSAFGEYSLPPSLRGNGLERRVIVVLVYVREATTPISLPLVVEVEVGRLRLYFQQPITAQVFYGLCWWRNLSLRYRPQVFNMFNLELKTWKRVPASTHQDNMIYLPLPLRHFPIFKPSSIVTMPHPEQFARGGRGFRAICLMKVEFIPHIKLLWPRGLKHPPLYIKAKWSVGRDDDGIIATCPGFSEEGHEIWEVDPGLEDADAAAAA
ncbi:uncharacterized protein B0H18DRAFT_1123311 [Fomitopsis serialis]|uniref:uncharacterized protein n=1 Tax=Fomitopsis serialis TaxID=139415 RepID=UPI00200745ED|nr:uncharacterized protein B0H18DRAFT_1123311 [Neoantrodia serialis]KAH9917947.1 hypothetical protein B0H18DRAFT_1123311 [Neoantrodia serialis]